MTLNLNLNKAIMMLITLSIAGCFEDAEYKKSVADNSYSENYSQSHETYVPTEDLDSTPAVLHGRTLDPPPLKNNDVYDKGVKSRRQKYVQNILLASKRFGVPPEMIHAIITKESLYKSQVASGAGAVGLMQLLDRTGRRFGCSNRRDAQCNINAGTAYLKFLSNRYGGNIQTMAAAYNAGEGVADSYLNGTKMPGKNPSGIKTTNGVPLASFAYTKSQKGRGCPSNNYTPSPECEGETYHYVRKVTWAYLFYEQNPQLIGKTAPQAASAKARQRGRI